MEKEAPLISIIIICYNNQDYIGKAIESCLNQDFDHPYEIIVVNDNSSDDSANIIKRYVERFNNVFLINVDCHQLLNVRFAGLDKANGKYACFLDGDDTYHQSMLKTMYKTITKYDADVVNCSLFFVKNGKNHANLFEKFKILNSYQAIKALFGDSYIRGFMYTKMYRSELIKDIAKKLVAPNENFMYEDFMANFLIFKFANKVVSIKDRLIYYNKSNPTSITKKNKRIGDNIKVNATIRYLIDFFNDKKLLKIFKRFAWRRFLSLTADIYFAKFDTLSQKIKISKIALKELKLLNKKHLRTNGTSFEEFIKQTKFKV